MKVYVGNRVGYFCHSFASHTCYGQVHEVGLSGRGIEDFGKPVDFRKMLMRKVIFWNLENIIV